MDLSPILCTRPVALARMEGCNTAIRGTVRFYAAPGGILIKAVFSGLPPQGAEDAILDLTLSGHTFPMVVPCGGHSFAVILTDHIQPPSDGTSVVLSPHKMPSHPLATGIIMHI